MIQPVRAVSSEAVLWQDPQVEGNQEDTHSVFSDACEDV